MTKKAACPKTYEGRSSGPLHRLIFGGRKSAFWLVVAVAVAALLAILQVKQINIHIEHIDVRR